MTQWLLSGPRMRDDATASSAPPLQGNVDRMPPSLDLLAASASSRTAMLLSVFTYPFQSNIRPLCHIAGLMFGLSIVG